MRIIHKNKYIELSIACVAIACCLGASAGKKRLVDADSPTEQTAAIVKTTQAFLNSLSTDERTKISFAFTAQKAAVAAKFARTGNVGGGPPPGGNGKPDRPQGGPPPNGGPPGGGKGGQFPGFIGEQYGQAVWSNYPVSDVPRPGLKLGSLTAEQREAAMHMLHELLSAKGYEKIMEI